MTSELRSFPAINEPMVPASLREPDKWSVNALRFLAQEWNSLGRRSKQTSGKMLIQTGTRLVYKSLVRGQGRSMEPSRAVHSENAAF